MTNSNPWSITTRTIVLAAIFGALILAMQLIGIGSIPVPNISGALTTLLIPAILGAVIGGPVVGLFAGLVMGVLYLILFPAFGPITHLPGRLLFPLAAWWVYNMLRGNNKIVAGAVAGVVGALVNTIVTVGLAVLQGQAPATFFAAVAPQAAIEAVACAIIIPIIATAVESALAARGN